MNEFSHFNLYGTLLEVKDAIARESITELVTTCGLLRDITNNLLEKSLGNDENIADILTDIDSINGAIEDIEKTIDELDGDISELGNEVADISRDLENLRIVVNADNETETYQYTDDYGITVTLYRRGKNVSMYLRTDGLTADLPTKDGYYTMMSIPEQFRPAVNTILTRGFDVMYSGQINIGDTVRIGYCLRSNYLSYNIDNESLIFNDNTVGGPYFSVNLPKNYGFYYRDSWVAK